MCHNVLYCVDGGDGCRGWELLRGGQSTGRPEEVPGPVHAAPHHPLDSHRVPRPWLRLWLWLQDHVPRWDRWGLRGHRSRDGEWDRGGGRGKSFLVLAAGPRGGDTHRLPLRLARV